MNQRQYPHRFAVDLIHQAIAFVRDQLAGPGNLSRLAQHGVLGDEVNFLQKPFTLQELATKVRDVLADAARFDPG